MMPRSTCRSCGTTGSGSADSGYHSSAAHFAGSMIRGVPDHERAVKKKSIRSSIGSPPRVRCIDVAKTRSRSSTPISSRASRRAASYAVSPFSTCPAAAAAQWSSM